MTDRPPPVPSLVARPVRVGRRCKHLFGYPVAIP
jgi:hypothetical protein